jgi:hypothetical protein
MRLRTTFSSVGLFVIALVVLTACGEHSAPVNAQTTSPSDPHIGACPIFSTKNVWNQPVPSKPVHPNSNNYVNRIGASSPLHPNFGSDPGNGIPITLITPDTPKVKVRFTFADESDPGDYPVPPNALIEGGPNAPVDSDRHIVLVDQVRCLLFEVGGAVPQPDGSWTAGAGIMMDLMNDARRPEDWTSADASGLPILPGLLRYDEVGSGEIRHAIRFTAPQTQRAYLWPATHEASSITDPSYPPMGTRFRLKADFDISGYSRDNQVILRALKRYGMILADNGSSWFITGTPDRRWNDDDLHKLQQITGSNFEAVDESEWQMIPSSARVDPTVP